MFSQSVPEHDVPAMQGREAEEEVKNWQELDDHGGRNMARTQRREHIDGRLKGEGFHVNSARDLFFCVLA